MKKLATLLTVLLLTVPAFAAEHTVKMLNSGKDGMMVFEPAVLSVNKGDTVKFVATDMHTIQHQCLLLQEQHLGEV